MGTDYGERKGANEALFREVNERLMERKKDDPGWSLPSLWVCECAEETCTERIEMSPLQYEELRSEPTHFAVVPKWFCPSPLFAERNRVVILSDLGLKFIE